MVEHERKEAPRSKGSWVHASGKAILFGEHAVVYGVPAIAAGISRGVSAQSSVADVDGMVVNGTLISDDHKLLNALRQLRDFLGVRPAQVLIESQIPKGSGLGSSAAMAVATVRALCSSHGIELSERRLFEAAQEWERVFHGNPSGVDVAAAQSGALIGYRRGAEPQRLAIAAPLHLVVAQAGPPASTKLMVEAVAKNKERNPAQFDRTLQGIASLVDNATILLRQGEMTAVGKLMDLNHMLLAGWMLSTEEIETACQVARASGALGAKLTGAGGGGCVIALAKDLNAQQEIKSALEAQSIPAFATRVEK